MMLNRYDHQQNMVRTRTGEIRKQSLKPYNWLKIWNNACHDLYCKHKDKSFLKHVIAKD